MSTASRQAPKYDRGLPADVDTERYVLGAILRGTVEAGPLLESLHIRDFILRSHQIILRRMLGLHQQNQPIDRVLLFDELRRHREHDKVGGLGYLISLDDGMPEHINIDHWINLLKRKSLFRRIIHASDGIGKRALLETENENDLVRDLLLLGEDLRLELARGALPVETRTAMEIYHGDYPELTPVVESILFPGLTLLAGRAKIGKSYLAMELAIAIASGQKFGGFLGVNKPGNVLYLSLEERAKQTRARLRRLTPDESFLDRIKFIHALPNFFTTGIAALNQELAAYPVEVVIIDSLLSLTQQLNRPSGMDAMQADYNTVSLIREVAEKNNATMVLIAHTRKATADYFVDAVQGTTGTTAAADAVWVLQKKNELTGILHVTGREVQDLVYGLKRIDVLWRIEGAGEEYTLSEERHDIIELLRDNGPMKPVDIARLLDKKTFTIYKLLRKLCAVNIVFRAKYGTYAIFEQTQQRPV